MRGVPYTPLLPAHLWSDPVGAQLRARGLRRRAPLIRGLPLTRQLHALCVARELLPTRVLPALLYPAALRARTESRASAGDMTQSYVRHDSFMCETWFIRMRDVTHSCVRHDAALQARIESRASVGDMTQLYVGLDSFACET